jgi:hypothetical protein
MNTQDTIEIGTKVCYASKFLKSIGPGCYEESILRGVVEDIKPHTTIGHNRADLMYIAWSNGEKATVIRCNLWPADKIHLEPR